MPKKKRITPVEYGGFILTFEPGRTQWLKERLHPEVDFSDSFSALDWDIEPRESADFVIPPSGSHNRQA
ncbi:hypothetical protein [Pseudomonas oryzihabitans]|uniref:hypothetical protein n=1 Tax=Pseudomonas oryzihabitans TaxID=47885 RepID=UPI00289432A2|nr:hypothetical protein [Pseudomonas oryzihabitans]MDT3721967.1 hypothetical protein [Pseudomonas oryzihabitans]